VINRGASGPGEGIRDIPRYDLNADIGETTNVQDQYPDVVKRLKALLQDYIDRGRSTPERHSNRKDNS